MLLRSRKMREDCLALRHGARGKWPPANKNLKLEGADWESNGRASPPQLLQGYIDRLRPWPASCPASIPRGLWLQCSGTFLS